MIQLSECRGDDYGPHLERRVLVNPNEIACVRAYCRHSFRPLVGEIVLQNGEKIRVWETVEQIQRLIERAATAKVGGGE